MKDVTYGQFVCNEQPEKSETNKTRFTVGGDSINYPGNVATPTAKMLVAKLLFNNTISTKSARFMTIDISNFYLNSPLLHPEFIKIKLSNIPEEITNKYNLREKATSAVHVYIVADKSMQSPPTRDHVPKEDVSSPSVLEEVVWWCLRALGKKGMWQWPAYPMHAPRQ